MLEIKNLCKRYGQTQALDNVQLSVGPGEIVGLFGENGAGKTTLMKCILQLILYDAGGITLDDCERFHRAVQPRVEQVDYDFLEVCSPGLDRPLKTDRDFARALNTPVEVKLYKPMDGRKTYQGTLAGFDRETLRLLTDEGEVCVGRKAAAQIKPVIIFEDEDGGESEL